MTRRAVTITIAACATLATLATPALAAVQAAHASVEVRVNQVGYAPGAQKLAYAMLPAPVTGVPFTVTSEGRVVYRGVSTDNLGGWNPAYRAVYELDFSSLRWPGTYQVHVGTAVSPSFRVASGRALYGQLAGNAVRYFTSERDGADVVNSVLNREPANLTDERAYVYAAPAYDSNDNLLGSLTRIGGPVDVSGGWFDAGGGYEKFGYTASYADGLLLMAARSAAGSDPALRQEAEFGLRWITKLWNPRQRVLYMQVGIGDGNASNTIQGDYNFWFLPQAEDRMDVKPGGLPGPPRTT